MATSYLSLDNTRQWVGRHRFDKDSGLVYRETVVSAPRSMARKGTPRYNFSSQSSGAPSLQDISIRSFLANVDSISPDTLLELPWVIGKRLWKYVVQFELEKPSLWYAFAAAYPDEEQFQYFRGSEINLQKPFSEYLDYLSCSGLQWLTCLTLSNINLDRADLMRIPMLKNLLAIDVYSSCPSHDCTTSAMIDDKTVRDWSRIAQEANSLQRLRVLILRNQHRVSSTSLEYLSAFPSLTLFGVKGCSLTDRHDEHAQRFGWTAHDLYGLMPKIQSEIEKSHHWDGALSVCVKHSARLLSSTNPTDPPILSFRLGHTSNDVLYSTPILFFRRLPNTCQNSPLASQSGEQGTNVPDQVDVPIAVTKNSETPAALQVTSVVPQATVTATPTATPTATQTTTPKSETSTKKAPPESHAHKKRKIRVSVQHRFGSILSDFGIDIVHQDKASKDSNNPPAQSLTANNSSAKHATPG